MYLLGVDIGSSSLKAVIFDKEGNTLAVEKAEYSISTPQEGYAEQNAEEYYSAFLKVLQKIDKAKLEKVEGMCVCGQEPTDIFVDESGTPLFPAIMWRDLRAKKQFEKQQEVFTFEQLCAFAE